MNFASQSRWSVERSPAFPASNRSASRTDSQSEPVDNPDGRLGPVGYAIGSKRWGQIEGWTVVNQPPILCANEDPVGEIEVGASAVNECSASLRRGCRRIRGSEYQAANASLSKRREVSQCMPVNVGCGHLMLVRLNS